LALSLCFTHGVNQPQHLYSFLNTNNLKNTFLGVINITKPFFWLALLAGITQAIQAFLAPQPVPPGRAGDNNMQNQFAQSLSVQTKYVLPVLIVIIASRLASAVALYWAVANIFSIIQELYLRRTVRNKLVTSS
jgi:membrane protein insertase Oxa1/YidC/SpoIIIJ